MEKNQPKIIAFFSPKGGVGKTTLVSHLAWILAAEHSRKVLIIDADPLCNLTHSLAQNAASEFDLNSHLPMGNLHSAVSAALGKPEMALLHPNREFVAECLEIRTDRGDASENGSSAVKLGSVKLINLEPQISFAHLIGKNEMFPAFRNVAGAFRRLFMNTARFYNAEFVFVDLSASIGELCKNLFFSCDYFLLPLQADVDSRSLIRSLVDILPLWREQQVRLAEMSEGDTAPVKKFPPKFIGAVLSMFNVAGKTFKPVKQASLWISLIEQSLDEELLPVLEALGMNRSSARTSVLAQVPSFLQLTQLSHSAYVPVFAVRGDMRAMDGEGDLVPVPEVERERHLAKAKWFKEVFCRFALEFLRVWEAGCVNKQ